MPTSSPSERRALGLGESVRIIRRRWRIVFACAVLVAGAAEVATLLQTPRYQASASLLFRDPGLDQKLFGSSFLPPSRDPNREAATNVRLVGLDAVAERTAAKLRTLTPGEVKRSIDVASEGQSDVVSVTATANRPLVAAEVANAFAREYIAFRREADRLKIREAQDLVQRQLDGLSLAERRGPQGRSLRERNEQLLILGSLQTGNAELVQPARPPGSQSSPRPLRNLVAGLFVGLLLGMGIVLVFDKVDRRIRTLEDLDELFDLPILSAVPESKDIKQARVDFSSMAFAEVEAFHTLRTNLRYFNVDSEVRSVMITSAQPGDGKSTVAWNLAASAASGGSHVVLVETDLRRPSVAVQRNLSPFPGLAEAITRNLSFGEVTQVVPVGNPDAPQGELSVIVAGAAPPNPLDLIESHRMREALDALMEQYDFMILDTPPVSVVSDALPLVGKVDGVIVVCRIGKTSRDAARAIKQQLDHLHAHVLGLVANGYAPESGAYYSGTYAYGTSSRADDRAQPAAGRR